MAYPDDLAEQMATDNEVWNDVETIQYFEKTAEKLPTVGVPVERTLWLTIRKDHLKADSLLAKMDMTVDLPGATLGAIVPKNFDLMQRGDGTRWVIMITEIVATGQEYRVHVQESRKGK